MPIVAIVNPKGGAGKSTAALVLGTTLARHGASVTAFDCDRNQPLVTWAAGGTRSALRVVSHLDPETIGRALRSEAGRQQFVIADLEGTASMTVATAIVAADLVLVPTRGSITDAHQAQRAINMVEDQAAAVGPRPYRLLFTCTRPGFQTRDERAIRETFEQGGVQILPTDLGERAAYRAMFSYQLALDELDPAAVNGVDKAIENADAFANDVVSCIEARADA